jgi:cell division GTPase FtsZ
MGILTVGVVTKPFVLKKNGGLEQAEGDRRSCTNVDSLSHTQ